MILELSILDATVLECGFAYCGRLIYYYLQRIAVSESVIAYFFDALGKNYFCQILKTSMPCLYVSAKCA